MTASATSPLSSPTDRRQPKALTRVAKPHVLLALLAFALVAPAAAAGSVKPTEPKLRQALDQVLATGVPGAVVLARDGGRSITLAGGLGNLKQKTATKVTDRFRVGSITKTFVATLVLRLV